MGAEEARRPLHLQKLGKIPARAGADCPVCQGRDPKCLVRLTAERRARGGGRLSVNQVEINGSTKVWMGKGGA
jgi:hypothetical protein